jgi:tetratricopeptide (TPR) repeat protein
MTGGTGPGAASQQAGEQPLNSWKEIATFFGRDQRTVRRWEKLRALPIHRIPGGQRGRVFAYPNELTNWLNSSADEEKATPVEPIPEALHPMEIVEPEIGQHETKIAEKGVASSWRRAASLLLATCLAVSVAACALWVRDYRQPSRQAADLLTPIRARQISTHNPQATELFLKGRYYWNRRTGDSLTLAVDDFSQAIALEPDYAEAYAGLADSYDLIREYTSMPDAEAYPRAIAAAEKAIALDDSLAEGHRALAFGLFYWKWDLPHAFAEYRRAIELNPKDPDAYHWYATSLFCIGRFDVALEEIEHARSLNPESPSILADRAFILFYAGHRSDSLAALRELEQAEPGFLSPPRYLARLDIAQGDYRDFLAQLDRAVRITKDPHEAAVLEAAKRGWAEGGSAKMLEAMERIQQEAVETGHSSGFEAAYICLLLGRREEAVRYLQAAYMAHDANLLGLRQTRFESDLRGVPGYERLRQKIQEYIELEPNRIGRVG